MPSTFSFSIARRMVCIYLAVLFASLLLVLKIAPHFAYTLDDAYIHLALAQGIAHGTYGINPGEVTSPSSSVLWPFLLAPLSHSAIRYWVPLFYNVIFSVVNCMLIASALQARLEEAWRGSVVRWCIAALLVLSANMVCLTLTGMEHSLQVTTVLASGIAILRAYEGRNIPWPLLLGAVIGPAIRYEDILFTVAVCVTLWLVNRRVAAGVTLLWSLVPLAVLGLFLHMHGLAFLPNSVIAKGGLVTARPHLFPNHLVLDHVLVIAAVNVIASIRLPERWPVDLLLALFAFLNYQQRTSKRALLLLPALLASVLMVLFGPYGWFYRYDVCLRVFLLLFTVHLLLAPDRKFDRRLVWAPLLAAASVYFIATLRTPFACQAIAMQQYQMHRFVHDFAKTNVAIGDLGLVSMDADGKYYILDLIGLASSEALNTKVRTGAWAFKIAQEHHVRLVMIYPDVLREIPPNWVLLGNLQNKRPLLPPVMPFYKVNFYATQVEDVPAFRKALAGFSSTLPAGTWFTEIHN